MILITGITGNTGKVIAEELKEKGIPFKGMVRKKECQRKLQDQGVETVIGDFDNPSSLKDALQGINTAYLVCTPDEHLVNRETTFINAAKEAGVKHIVKCSAFLADINEKSKNLRSHAAIEKCLIESGISYTILRPIGFMQTLISFQWNMIEKADVISLPVGDGVMPHIDLRDVAKCAFLALTSPNDHKNKIYDLTGPKAIDMNEVAHIMTGVLNRQITYIPGKEKQFKFIMKLLGIPEVPRQHVLLMMEKWRRGRLTKVYKTFETIGISPTTFEEFASDWIKCESGLGESFETPDGTMAKLLNYTMPPFMKLLARLQA